jgi:hypothetical protein
LSGLGKDFIRFSGSIYAIIGQIVSTYRMYCKCSGGTADRQIYNALPA